MNMLVFVFLFFCGVAGFAKVVELKAIKRKKLVFDYYGQAHNMIGLLSNGHVLRHTLTNDSSRSDYKEYLAAYGTFLNDVANVNGIKKIEGSSRGVL